MALTHCAATGGGPAGGRVGGRAVHALREVEQLWRRLEDATVGDSTDDEKATVLRALEDIEERLTRAAAQLGT
ncbi:hypothetical protein [Streptomyces puniciscabiei]|uniref:hypothetical protein n=1 Tax=Streptomyces puniciscabiei TaxID=164348 RepID=UPI00332B7094